MTSKLTRERIEQYANDPRMCNINDEISELARMALAAMDSEPVASDSDFRFYVDDQINFYTHLCERHDAIGNADSLTMSQNRLRFYQRAKEFLYRHAQPAPERDQVRSEHAEWSQDTFGNVGPIGPLKHLRKEVLEVIAKPHDLIEWADMQFLLWDAQRRAGITDEQITQAMIEKLAVNKLREWPEPKDGEPRFHIKEQPAPVTQQEPIAWLNDAYLARGVVDGEAGSEDAGPGYIPVYREPATQPAAVVPEKATVGEMPFLGTVEGVYVRGWNDCRAAMLQELKKGAGVAQNCRSNENVQVLQAGNCREIANSSTNNCREIPETSTNRSREHFISLCNEFWNWSEMDLICADDRGYELRMEWDGDVFKHPVTQALWRMYQAAPGNSPVIPDGLIGAVNRLLDSDGSRGCYSAMECYDAHKEIESLLTPAPQEVTGE